MNMIPSIEVDLTEFDMHTMTFKAYHNGDVDLVDLSNSMSLKFVHNTSFIGIFNEIGVGFQASKSDTKFIHDSLDKQFENQLLYKDNFDTNKERNEWLEKSNAETHNHAFKKSEEFKKIGNKILSTVLEIYNIKTNKAF